MLSSCSRSSSAIGCFTNLYGYLRLIALRMTPPSRVLNCSLVLVHKKKMQPRLKVISRLAYSSR
eukprot:1390112-Alexandrium_andersonii.AAC.1